MCIYETNNEFRTFIVVLEKMQYMKLFVLKKIIGLENQKKSSVQKIWYSQQEAELIADKGENPLQKIWSIYTKILAPLIAGRK